ncbi:hypothetical protein EGT74_03005 [Chitinophaga lutea]|uniref:Carboxypeptidase regulatory-like domain-containing protein n=1 Tax=Chitinophaga lutea TaxID=2488634 RepID=A0A3N4Q926_9BACT|nr:hypothetical protein [Chitinophaga lutea]RPE12537.1 hypothetical protein EGT74_03005 [Chitinophaga lutea]
MTVTRFRLFRALTAVALVCAVTCSKGQTIVKPDNQSLESKWLKNGQFEMACFINNGGEPVQISSFAIEINANKETVSIYTAMNLVGSEDMWIDTSITDASFKPIYRSSFNRNREMVLTYGKEVTGYYYDRQTDQRTTVKEAVKEAFFDSYAYPYLLGLLPLASGYSATMPVYDYKPDNSTNIKKAVIEEVKSNTYTSSHSGTRKVWQVSVFEPATNDRYEYYIDKETRRLWKVDIQTKGQQIAMIDREADYNPIKSKFDKATAMKMIKSGKSVISGQAFARDNQNSGSMLGGIAVLNVNKKQYARKGTSVVLIPYTDFFREWVKVNDASRKKGQAIPLPKEAAECIKVTTIYDDKGSFEFVNLTPGEYLVFSEFGYTHTTHRTEVTGYSDRYVNGLYQGTMTHTTSRAYDSNAAASVRKTVTIDKDGEKVEIKLKKTL